MTNEEAFDIARHNGRYGHYDSVVWQVQDGDGWMVQRYSAESVQTALLAVGTQGKFYVVGTGHPRIVKWREGNTRLRNAKRGWL